MLLTTIRKHKYRAFLFSHEESRQNTKKEVKMMASLVLFDLDLELDLASVYKNAKDTIAYLEDLVKSIDKRVLSGEVIPGLQVVQGRGNRYITPPGERYLASVLGEDKFYKTIKKPLTLTELSNEMTQSEIDMLEKEGYISRKEGSPKVEAK